MNSISLAVTKSGKFFRTGAAVDIPISEGGQVMNCVVTTIYWSERYDLIVILDSGSYLHFPENAIEFTKVESGQYPIAADL